MRPPEGDAAAGDEVALTTEDDAHDWSHEHSEDVAAGLAAADGDLVEASSADLIAELDRLSSDLAAAIDARVQAERERDEARLVATMGHDFEDSRDATVASLRATIERQLQRLSDVEVTIARLRAEREEAVRRAEAAEGALLDSEAALRRREWEAAGLARDLERYGRSPAPKG